jgi:hypothetical protein
MKSDKPADPLAAFRRKPVEGDKTPALNKESESYVAFAGKDRVERLQIRRVKDPVRAPRYLQLYDITYDAHYGLNFTLYFDHMMVMVRGKNLQGLVAALLTGTVDFIQEYHPDLWPQPGDGEPVIDIIHVAVKGDAPDDDTLMKKKKRSDAS